MKNSFSFTTIKNYFNSEDKTSGRRRLFNSIWSLIFGILASFLIILITGNNPFEVFKTIFQDSIGQETRFITTTVVFIVATLGTAMCFKSGIFNIGVSGQMMAGGMTTILILKLIGVSSGTVVLSIFISILIGGLVAFFAASLKAFFNVNEVVLTILLNWIIFYIIKFIIKSEFPGLTTATSVSQGSTEAFVLPAFFQSIEWMVILSIFGGLIILSVWFIFTKTTFGYKMKMLSMNKDASKYSGSNEKLMVIVIMTVAGCFAGFAGFLYYSELGQITASFEPLSMGFDTIAIALLVYNNPFGIGISSILFTVIKLGCGILSATFEPLNQDFAQIMFGVIIYIAAISKIFEKINIYSYFKNVFICTKNSDYRKTLKIYWANILYIRKTAKKNKSKIKLIKNSNRKTWKSIKKHAVSNAAALDKNLLLNGKNISNLNVEQQEQYFLKINLIKKEKDQALFESQYFEIAKIKNYTKTLKLENKNMLRNIKQETLSYSKSKTKKEVKNATI